MTEQPQPASFEQHPWWERYRAILGSWMLSMSVHVMLLLLFALIVLPVPPQDLTKYLTIRTQVTENPPLETIDNVQVTPEKLTDGNVSDLASMTLPTNIVAEQPSPVDIDADFQELQWEAEAAQFLGQIHRQGDLAGRSQRARTILTRAFGGTADSEAAVSNGLKWLQEHQRKDGSWSFDHVHSACGDACSAPGSLGRATVGATAMALLCFVGAGQTHQDGDYQEVVQKGLDFILQEFAKAKTPGDLRQLTSGNSGMYTQGLITIALCELHGLTRDRRVAQAAQRCINFIVQAQHPQNGGWRYSPNAEVGDTSVVGWNVMAFTSARMARLSVPGRNRQLASRFLDSVQLDDGAYYGYTRPQRKASTTSIGLLCRMYEGWGPDREPLRKGVEFLSKQGPSRDNMYYNYYATQVLHHWGGEKWDKWNEVMREQLVTTQVKQGHARGSWAPRDPHARHGGRHYMTCLAILTLEVYYRHLPLYQKRSVEMSQ